MVTTSWAPSPAMKRTADADSSSPPPPPKRPASLATWLSLPAPVLPSPVVASDPVTDRGSTFVAHAAPCLSAPAALLLQSHVRALVGPASHPTQADHEVLAWRIIDTRLGKSGLAGADDWTVKTGIDDDDEKGGGATVRKVLEDLGQVDVAVVVSRYYGGVMLGPVRFDHIRTVATQAIQRLSRALALPPLLAQLRALDDRITALLPPSATAPPKPDYRKLTVETAERLIKAREKRLELLQARKRDEDESRSREDDPPPPKVDETTPPVS